MYLLREMVDSTMTPVLQTVIQLAFTPFPLGRLTRTAVKPTTMSSVHAKWLSRSATTVGRSREQTIPGMPTIKW